MADMLSPYIVVNTLTPPGVGVFFYPSERWPC